MGSHPKTVLNVILTDVTSKLIMMVKKKQFAST